MALHPCHHKRALISTKNIENLIPDFLMDSSLFYLVILDVEGRVVKQNQNFQQIHFSADSSEFKHFLSPSSVSEFDYSLDLLLTAPRVRRHLVLDHVNPDGGKPSKVWWEFSVITTLDMDISGIIGIGVGMKFLEEEMPWDSLVDILGFGNIALDDDLSILHWDEQISAWFEPKKEMWTGKRLTDLPAFRSLKQLNKLDDGESEQSHQFFLIKGDQTPYPDFAALISSSAEGYQLLLLPKEPSLNTRSEMQLVPPKVLVALPGAVLVLDRAGKLCQQNEEAKNLARVWKGRAYSEGFCLTVPAQANRFAKLLRAIEEAKKGNSSDLELRLLMPHQEFEFWTASVRPIQKENEEPEGILIQVFNQTFLRSQLAQVNRENERLRDLALSPSHVLRGPLSSIIGILELIDGKQLDKENQKLFNYLKPLTKELDQVIRQHAKKVSTF